MCVNAREEVEVCVIGRVFHLAAQFPLEDFAKINRDGFAPHEEVDRVVWVHVLLFRVNASSGHSRSSPHCGHTAVPA